MVSDISSPPRALGVIPARGGSKRLPRKNVRDVAGHPLIAHTIMAAQAATGLSDFLVTSEDTEIIEVAKRYGAPVPFVREKLSILMAPFWGITKASSITPLASAGALALGAVRTVRKNPCM